MQAFNQKFYRIIEQNLDNGTNCWLEDTFDGFPENILEANLLKNQEFNTNSSAETLCDLEVQSKEWIQ